MKRFTCGLALSCLMLAIAASAQTNINVVYSFLNSFGQTQNVKKVSFTPLAPVGVFNSSIIVGDTVDRVVTATTLTNPMFNGYSYRVSYYGATTLPPTTVFTNYFPTNTPAAPATVFARDYVAISTNLGNGLYALTLPTAQALFDPLGAATNAANLIGLLNLDDLTGLGTLAVTGNIVVATNAFGLNGYVAAFHFLGEGSGISNLDATHLFGTVGLSHLPGAVVTNLPPGNGSNDWPMLQAALSTPNSYIRFGGSYIVSNTIFATNNIVVDGCGYSLSFARGLTNSLIDCGSSNVMQSFFNLTFNGLEPSNYMALATIPIPLNAPEIYDNGTGVSVRGSSVRNRNGLRINSNGGGIVANDSFTGFSGCGLLVFGYQGDQSYRFPVTKFMALYASSNFISFFNGGGFWDGVPSYNAFYNPLSSSRDSGEYAELLDSFAWSSGIGIYWSAGNASVRGCYANLNLIALAATGGGNNNHGDISASTFNHNTYGAAFASANGRVYVRGCNFLANSQPINIADGTIAVFTGDSFEGAPCTIITNANSLTATTLASFNGCNALQTAGSTGATNYCNVVSSNGMAFLQGGSDTATGINNDGTFTFGSCTITNSTSTGLGVVTYSGHAGDGSGLTNVIASAVNGTLTNNISGPAIGINVGGGSFTGGGVTINTAGVTMAGGGNVFTGNGSGITALNASSLATGNVPSSVLTNQETFRTTMILSSPFTFPSNFVNSVAATNCPFLTRSNLAAGTYKARLVVKKLNADMAGSFQAGLAFSPGVTNENSIVSYQTAGGGFWQTSQTRNLLGVTLDIPGIPIGASSSDGFLITEYIFNCTNTTAIAAAFEVSANVVGVINTAWLEIVKQ